MPNLSYLLSVLAPPLLVLAFAAPLLCRTNPWGCMLRKR